MEDTSFLAPLLLTIGGLVIGALLKSLLRHTRIPCKYSANYRY